MGNTSQARCLEEIDKRLFYLNGLLMILEVTNRCQSLIMFAKRNPLSTT